jgi:hypothetical protein
MMSLVRFQRNYKKIRKNKTESFYNAHLKIVKNNENKTTILRSEKEVADFLKNL